MKEPIPTFRYHPDPIATGALKPSNEMCDACGQRRGFTYTASFYAIDEVENLCPWCIADGSAAKKFDGTFSDDYPLREAGVSEEIIVEVVCRTPGFTSWQQDRWLTCCDDACEFHGDASRSEVKAMSLDEVHRTFEATRLPADFVEGFKASYQPAGDPAVYRWVCRHCRTVRYYADFT